MYDLRNIKQDPRFPAACKLAAWSAAIIGLSMAMVYCFYAVLLAMLYHDYLRMVLTGMLGLAAAVAYFRLVRSAAC